MQGMLEHKLACPYCGELIDVLIDGSLESQEYIEDCQVCCRPIVFRVEVAMNGEANVQLYRDDDAY